MHRARSSPVLALAGSALLASGCAQPPCATFAAYRAPTREGAQVLRYVDWYPIPGRITTGPGTHELPRVQDVHVECLTAECSSWPNGVLLKEAQATSAPLLPVRISKAGYRPLTTSLQAGVPCKAHVVLLEPEGAP